MLYRNPLVTMIFCFPLRLPSLRGRYRVRILDSENFYSNRRESMPSFYLPASLEGVPNAFVYNCVNAISGQYCESQTDLVSYGSDPLLLERRYCGAVDIEGNFCSGWSLNHGGCLEIESEDVGHFRMPQWGHRIRLSQEFGYFLEFGGISVFPE